VGSHGVIGDLETLALVGEDATLEWLCWPRFDSPSIFGSLLDTDGGEWSIKPTSPGARQRQLYLPETNVIVTRFHHPDGLVEVQDFMNATGSGRAIVRQVTGIRGQVDMRSAMRVRPDYGRAIATWVSDQSSGTSGLWFEVDGEKLYATSTVELDLEEGEVGASFSIGEGDSVAFCLGVDPEPNIDQLGNANERFWRDWIEQSTYSGRWSEIVKRSALTLKLLTHEPTGGLIAAGTSSLPEALDGERNWDYRYVWIRDAAFTLYAFMELGFHDEAEAFTAWLDARLAAAPEGRENGPLSPLYDLDGNDELDEQELDHWSGYRNTSPVRIGNGASGQLQLDIYGELMDSMYLADKKGRGLSLESWQRLCGVIEWVCENWDQPDDGIWEVRSGRDRFTSSALMCWVALERGIRMATERGRPADLERWRRTRDVIHNTITTEAWNNDVGAFTQTFGGDNVDASILLMPLVKFVAGDDPQWLSTLEVLEDQLVHGVLVDRYDNSVADDGLEGDDGSFSICSFWYVEALTRAGRTEQARGLFERMLTYAGPLGLFSEVISPNGEQLGNYPQAFTHLSLISAAVHLDKALDHPTIKEDDHDDR